MTEIPAKAETKPKSVQPRMETFASLRFPNFRLWFLGQTLSLMGTWMQSVAQGWVVYQLTSSELALGAVSFIGTIPTLFLMLPGGVIVDRVPRRRLLLVTQTVMMLLAFIMGGLAATGKLQVWQIAVLAAILGITQSFDAPGRQALAVEMVEDRRYLSNAIALNSTIFNLARIVGPAIGGAVLAAVGAAWCFGLNGLSFVAVLIALLLMRLPSTVAEVRSAPLLEQTMIGLRYVWNDVPIRTMMLLVAVGALFGSFYAVLLPAFAATVLNVGEIGLGGLNVAVGVGALIGSLIVASLSQWRHKPLLLTAASLLFPVALLGLAATRSFPVCLVSLALVGVGFVTQNASINTLIQEAIPDELRGRVMAVYSLTFFGTAPFSALLAGGLAQAFGPRIGVAIGATVTLLFALWVIIFVPSVRRMRV
jgi:MFS family permease